MKTLHRVWASLCLIGAASALGCSGDAERTTGRAEALSGGSYDRVHTAVGLVSTTRGSCVGSLIAPSYALMAASCAGPGMAFKGAAVDEQIPHPSLDLLIAHLASPITGVPPLSMNGSALPSAGQVCTTVGGHSYAATSKVDSASASQITTEAVTGVAQPGDEGAPLLCGNRVAAVVHGSADAVGATTHVLESYTPVDLDWIAATLGRGSAFGGYVNAWGSFNGTHGNLLGDIDGDGRSDLVGLGDGYVGAIRSNGKAFGAYETWWGGTFSGTHGTLLGDVDGDGRADLVALDDGHIDVIRSGVTAGSTGYIGGPATHFGPVETWWPGSFYGAWGRAGLDTFLADVDGDGRADLVGLGYGYIGVIRSTGKGFGPYETWWGGSYFGTNGTLIGDVDGDGRADLVELNGNGTFEDVMVLRSTGSGFRASPELWYTDPFYGTHGTLLADIDGDGRSDLVGLGDGFVAALRSTGTSFGAYETWWGGSFYGSHGTMLGDVTGDHRADLVGVGDGYIGMTPATVSLQTVPSTLTFGTVSVFGPNVSMPQSVKFTAPSDGNVTADLTQSYGQWRVLQLESKNGTSGTSGVLAVHAGDEVAVSVALVPDATNTGVVNTSLNIRLRDWLGVVPLSATTELVNLSGPAVLARLIDVSGTVRRDGSYEISYDPNYGVPKATVVTVTFELTNLGADGGWAKVTMPNGTSSQSGVSFEGGYGGPGGTIGISNLGSGQRATVTTLLTPTVAPITQGFYDMQFPITIQTPSSGGTRTETITIPLTLVPNASSSPPSTNPPPPPPPAPKGWSCSYANAPPNGDTELLSVEGTCNLMCNTSCFDDQGHYQFNYYRFVRATDTPVGQSLEVCNGQQLPDAGWVVAQSSWYDPNNHCYPDLLDGTANVMTFHRQR